MSPLTWSSVVPADAFCETACGITPGDIRLSLFNSGVGTGSLHCLTLKITQKLLRVILLDSFHMNIGIRISKNTINDVRTVY